MTPTTRAFPLGTILTLTTERMLASSFSEVHELAEWVLGHPVWTHEFGDSALWGKMRGAILAQHPALAEVDDSVVTRENAHEVLNGWKTQYGDTLEITSGTERRQESPLESLQRLVPGARAMAAVVPSPGSNQPTEGEPQRHRDAEEGR